MPDKVTKRIRIDFKGAKGALKDRIKREVGEIAVEEIINYLSSAKSPVSNGKYKTFKKDKTPAQLLEDGDLWESIEFEEYRDGVEVGVFDADQIGKAYGHNSGFKGHPTIPEGKYQREFIPTGDKDFKKTIRDKIKRRVNEILREENASKSEE